MYVQYMYVPGQSKSGGGWVYQDMILCLEIPDFVYSGGVVSGGHGFSSCSHNKSYDLYV